MKKLNLLLFMAVAGMLILVACQPQSADSTTDSSSSAVPSMTIHEAAFMGNDKAIQQHITAGSDLNEKDDYGSTPLMIALTFDRTTVAQLLIEAGADLEVRSADGSTALHSAALFGRKVLVAALLEAGANTEARNNYGSTALEVTELPFSQVKPIYDQISKDLGPLGFKLNYQQLEAVRPAIADLIRNH